MNEHGLTSEEIKKRHVTEIGESTTFKAHGVSKQTAEDFLDTPEGARFWQSLAEADPHATTRDIDERAIDQITSGRDLPRMEVINEPLAKIVPFGDRVSPFSPFFAKRSEFEDALAKGHNLSERFGLPIKSEAAVYDVFEIRPKGPTEVFVSRVAPTSELGGQVTRAGGAEQYLVPNRNLYSETVRVTSLGNDLAFHRDLVVSKGLGSPIVAAEAVAARGLRGGPTTKGLGAAGVAITAYDAADTFHETARLRRQGNDTAAQARIERFAIQNATGWTGAATFAGIGAAAGVKTGPGLLVTGALGGVIGAVAGDKVSEWINERKVNRQQDSLGNTWTFDPRHSEKGWTREQRELDMQQMSATTVDMPIYKTRTLTADATLSDQLTWRASSTSIELALGAPPQGRDPFTLAANEQDARSAREAPWSRDPESLQWTREVSSIVDYRHNNPVYRMRLEEASPQRGAELERESRAVIARNANQTPAAMAAQFQAVYEKNGWSRHGALPDGVTHALRHADRIVGSDGRLYERNPHGQWTHDGLLWDTHARANLKAELEATYQQQQANADIPTLDPVRVTAPRQLQEDNIQQQPATPSPQAQLAPPHDFRDPAHPQHARYAQTLAAVHAMEADHGIAPSPNSEKVAAAFVDRMQQTGFQELARMELRGSGATTELVALPRQFGPWDEKKPALVLSADQAVARSVEQATAAWAARALPHLDTTSSPPQVSLASSAHPAAAGLGELRGQVASAYAAAGIARSDEQIEQATAAVAVGLRQGHRSQADAVFLQPDRAGTFGPHCALIAVHGDKDDVFRHRSVTPAQELQRPSEDSYLQLAQLSQQQAREQALAHQRAQQQGQSASMGV
jgi:outer membrane lipoprotein SlyB